jgi:ABC-type transport system involved in cytochrome bd biosynthesis fused ATPase/permease subunit
MFNTSSPKMLKQFWGLLTNRWGCGCFALLAFQQIIEGSSTIWLVTVMKKITSGEPFFIFLLLYLGSLTTPYIPGCLASILKISWKQEAQRSFINAFVNSNHDQIGEWNNKGIKEEKLSILTAEGPNALHALIDYVFDLYNYLVSVFFNILALSVVVEPLFAVAYGISVLLVMAVMKAKRRIQRRLTQKALTARIDLYQSLLAAWDNVLLGNRYNFKLWQDRTTQRLNRCLLKNVELERFDQILAITISLLTSVPSLIVVIYYVYHHQNSVPYLSAFIVTLPVLFTILSYTYQTLSLIFRWTMHRSKLIAIYKAIQPIQDSHTAMEKKIKWPKIQIINSPSLKTTSNDYVSLAGPRALSCYQDLLNYTNGSGRLTLRGENGAGKSTLLMLIKNTLSDRAFFLPTQNQLSFVSETNKYSTGESLRNRLLEILERVDVDVLLLDEWDANLDSENQERLSQLIDELAVRKCVIEVRHRF